MTTQQQVLLSGMMAFSHVAEELDLVWFADGGTLLGAVRHEGFIPWDDDVDIMLPPEDYDILYREGPKYFKEPYFFQTKDTENNSPWNFIKLRNSESTCFEPALDRKGDGRNHGLFVDIFKLTEYTPGRYANMSWNRVIPKGGYEKKWWDYGHTVKFENILNVNIPCGYKNILEVLYGKNWTTPKRVKSKHSIIFNPAPYKEMGL